ncbi:benzoyl-CoA 2,3-epoxidase subunit BoxB, partial [bacterium]|nr:benzoyl-CoA 2,3-epoxidase subunit BoxB [bacterium]
GTFMGSDISPLGDVLTKEAWDKDKNNFLPATEDNVFIESLMKPVSEPGKYAEWISAPDLGIDNKPGDFEYVKIHDA